MQLIIIISFSITSYTFDEDITDLTFNRLNKFYDKKEKPKEVTKLKKEIKFLDIKYKVFEIAKLFTEMITTYQVEEGDIIAKEEEKPIWKHSLAYISKDSKIMYLNGQNDWPTNLISNILFNDPNKINPQQIDIKKIENDIRSKHIFNFNGTSFEDADGTKVSISNPGGISIDGSKYLKGNENTEKKNLKIPIQKDGKNFNVAIYPSGKITFGGRVTDEETALTIFIKVFDEIRDYIS